MSKQNSFSESKWFTVRDVGSVNSGEMGVFKATTRNHFRVKLYKVIHEKFPDVKVPDDFDPLFPKMIRTEGCQIIVVIETKLF